MGIYYIDPTNGDNANDGTSPSTAWASFQNCSAEDDLATVYARRNTTIDQSNTSVHLEWANIARWPTSDDDGYDSRPQDGIDAGWDDDDEVNPKVVCHGVVFNYNSDNSDKDCFTNLYKLDFEGQDNDTVNKIFTCYALHSDIVGCRFTSPGKYMRIFYFYGGNDSDNCNITLTNTTIDTRDDNGDTLYHSIVFYGNVSTSHIYYTKNITINNCEIYVKNLLYNHCGGYYIYPTNVVINDSTISVGSYGISWGGPYDNYCTHSDVKFTIANSTINTHENGNLFTLAYDNNGYGSKLQLIASDTSFYSGSAALVYCRGYYSGSHIHIKGMEIQNCSINGAYIVNFPSNGQYTGVHGDIKIENSTISNCSTIFNFDGLSAISWSDEANIYLKNNIYSEIVNLIKIRSGHANIGEIELVKTSLSGYFSDGKILGGQVFISDCLIQKQLTTSLSEETQFRIIASDIDAISGQVTVIANGTRISTSEEVVSDGATVIATVCDIESSNSSVVGRKAHLISRNSNIVQSNELVDGLLKLDNSYLNGTLVKHGYSSAYSKTLSPSSKTRDTGGETVEIVLINDTLHDTAIVGDLYYTKVDGQDSYTVYMASKEQTSLKGIAYFVKDGKLNPKELTIETDDSTWNNLPTGFMPFKASCDLSLDDVAVGAQLMFSVTSTLSIDNPSVIVDKTIIGA